MHHVGPVLPPVGVDAEGDDLVVVVIHQGAAAVSVHDLSLGRAAAALELAVALGDEYQAAVLPQDGLAYGEFVQAGAPLVEALALDVFDQG